MGKPVIILADTDEQYLAPLEIKFLEALDDKVELEIITDTGYFRQHFASPQNAEILLVSEELYSGELQKQNISNIYVLTESIEESDTEDLGIKKIFKYTNTNEIYNQIMATSRGKMQKELSKTKETIVVLFYSAAGGVGKTTLAMAMCGGLKKNFKKVLYVNAHRVNSFQFYLDNTAAMPNSVYTELANPDASLFGRIRHVIRNEGFDYLPPFAAALSSVDVDFNIYEHIIQSAKATKEYDVIVVDADSTFDYAKASLITMADRVMIVTTQSRASVNATNMLIKNMNCGEKVKYLFVCNQFDPDKFNALVEETSLKPNFTVSEYVKKIPDIDRMDLSEIVTDTDMQKLPFWII